MPRLEDLKEILHEKNASLVVGYANGEVKEYYKNRINDIKDILHEDEKALEGAVIADKVIGKVASSVLVVAGVKEIYTDVLSRYAVPVLEENHIKYEYEKLVPYVQNNAKDGMCPMENKFRDEKDIHIVYNEMINK